MAFGQDSGPPMRNFDRRALLARTDAIAERRGQSRTHRPLGNADAPHRRFGAGGFLYARTSPLWWYVGWLCALDGRFSAAEHAKAGGEVGFARFCEIDGYCEPCRSATADLRQAAWWRGAAVLATATILFRFLCMEGAGCLITECAFRIRRYIVIVRNEPTVGGCSWQNAQASRSRSARIAGRPCHDAAPRNARGSVGEAEVVGPGATTLPSEALGAEHRARVRELNKIGCDVVRSKQHRRIHLPASWQGSGRYVVGCVLAVSLAFLPGKRAGGVNMRALAKLLR